MATQGGRARHARNGMQDESHTNKVNFSRPLKKSSPRPRSPPPTVALKRRHGLGRLLNCFKAMADKDPDTPITVFGDIIAAGNARDSEAENHNGDASKGLAELKLVPDGSENAQPTDRGLLESRNEQRLISMMDNAAGKSASSHKRTSSVDARCGIQTFDYRVEKHKRNLSNSNLTRSDSNSPKKRFGFNLSLQSFRPSCDVPPPQGMQEREPPRPARIIVPKAAHFLGTTVVGGTVKVPEAVRGTKLERMGVLPAGVTRSDAPEPKKSNSEPTSADTIGFNIDAKSGTFSSTELATTLGSSITKASARSKIPSFPARGSSLKSPTEVNFAGLGATVGERSKLLEKELPPTPLYCVTPPPMVRAITAPGIVSPLTVVGQSSQGLWPAKRSDTTESTLPFRTGVKARKQTICKGYSVESLQASLLSPKHDSMGSEGGEVEYSESKMGKGKKDGRSTMRGDAPAFEYSPSFYSPDKSPLFKDHRFPTWVAATYSPSIYSQGPNTWDSVINKSEPEEKPRLLGKPLPGSVHGTSGVTPPDSLRFSPRESPVKSLLTQTRLPETQGPFLDMRLPSHHARSKSDQSFHTQNTSGSGLGISPNPAPHTPARPRENQDASHGAQTTERHTQPADASQSENLLTPFMAEHGDYDSPSFSDFNPRNPSALPTPLYGHITSPTSQTPTHRGEHNHNSIGGFHIAAGSNSPDATGTYHVDERELVTHFGVTNDHMQDCTQRIESRMQALNAELSTLINRRADEIHTRADQIHSRADETTKAIGDVRERLSAVENSIGHHTGEIKGQIKGMEGQLKGYMEADQKLEEHLVMQQAAMLTKMDEFVNRMESLEGKVQELYSNPNTAAYSSANMSTYPHSSRLHNSLSSASVNQAYLPVFPPHHQQQQQQPNTMGGYVSPYQHLRVFDTPSSPSTASRREFNPAANSFTHNNYGHDMGNDSGRGNSSRASDRDTSSDARGHSFGAYQLHNANRFLGNHQGGFGGNND